MNVVAKSAAASGDGHLVNRPTHSALPVVLGPKHAEIVAELELLRGQRMEAFTKAEFVSWTREEMAAGERTPAAYQGAGAVFTGLKPLETGSAIPAL